MEPDARISLPSTTALPSNDSGASIEGNEASSVSASMRLPGAPADGGRISVPFSM